MRKTPKGSFFFFCNCFEFSLYKIQIIGLFLFLFSLLSFCSKAFGSKSDVQSPHFKGKLSEFWAQEYIGADLARQELKTMRSHSDTLSDFPDCSIIDSFPPDSPSITDGREYSHGVAVSNLISHPREQAVFPFVNDCHKISRTSSDSQNLTIDSVHPEGVINLSMKVDDEILNYLREREDETAFLVSSSGNLAPEALWIRRWSNQWIKKQSNEMIEIPSNQGDREISKEEFLKILRTGISSEWVRSQDIHWVREISKEELFKIKMMREKLGLLVGSSNPYGLASWFSWEAYGKNRIFDFISVFNFDEMRLSGSLQMDLPKYFSPEELELGNEVVLLAPSDEYIVSLDGEGKK